MRYAVSRKKNPGFRVVTWLAIEGTTTLLQKKMPIIDAKTKMFTTDACSIGKMHTPLKEWFPE